MSIKFNGFPPNSTASGNVGGTSFSVTWQMPDLATLPLISGTQRPGFTLTANVGHLTNVSSYQWKVNGSNSVTTSTLDTTGLAADDTITVVVVCDEGTLTSPPVTLYATGMAGHNTTNDGIHEVMRHSDATHVAAATGDWSNSATWLGGRVPGPGACVLIPEGITVTYDVSTSPRLDRLRIDGTLEQATDQSTHMLFETAIVTFPGTWGIGTSAAPLSSSYDVDIVISGMHWADSDGVNPTDCNITQDTEFLGRGILSLGYRRWHGASVTPWVRTLWGQAAPASGDTSITLASVPTGWALGREILIPGTQVCRANARIQNQDERREISTFTDNGDGTATVTFTPALDYDHDHHNSAVTRTDLQPPVALMWRNIKVSSETTTPSYRRGHMLDAHGCRMELTNVWAYEMGRTDKMEYSGKFISGNFERPDPSDPLDSPHLTTTQTSQRNLQARYPFHNHHGGFAKAWTDEVSFCLVENTPGWGITHHQSKMKVNHNVVYAAQGAGIVAEDGNETGEWKGNLVMSPQPYVRLSTHPKDDIYTSAKQQHDDLGKAGDFHRHGYGMSFRGRAVIVTDNMVVGCSNGIAYTHRYYDGVDKTYPSISEGEDHDRDTTFFPDLTYPQTTGDISKAKHPIAFFDNNEVVACAWAMAVFKSTGQQIHDVSSHFQRLKVWAGMNGVFLQYVVDYTFTFPDFVSGDLPSGTPDTAGMDFNFHTANLVLVGGRFEGWYQAVHLSQDASLLIPGGGSNFDTNDTPRYLLVECDYKNNSTDVYYATDYPAEEPTANTTRIEATIPTFVEPSTDLPRNVGVVNLGSSITTRTYGVKTDSLPALSTGLVFPTVWDGSGWGDPGADAAVYTDYQTYTDEFGYYTNGGKDVFTFDVPFSDRIYGKVNWKTHAVEISAFHGGSTATNNGAITWDDTNVPVQSSSPYTESPTVNDAGVTTDVVTGATHAGSGTVTLSDKQYPPLHGTLTLNTGAGTVTYVPDEDFTGDDEASVYLTDSLGNFTRVELRYKVGTTTPAAFTSGQWAAAGGSGQATITLSDYPDAGGETIYSVEYSTDATNWKRLCHLCILDAHVITTESDGTALTAGSYTINLRYTTRFGTTTAEVTGKSVTVT